MQTIYEYHKTQYLNGIVNRRRIRKFYDPDVTFFSYRYHEIWKIPNRDFIILEFKNENMKTLFEIEFGKADLTELDEIPEQEKFENTP